jgi:hypothetical protein
MSKELECPYCGYMCRVPDDCYEPSTPYETQCSGCERYFGFTIEYWPSYTEYVLPCANGEPHDYQPVHGYPRSNRVRCTYCEDETTADKIEKIEEL